MVTNCVNCVAPIDPKLNKCPYCGTSYEAMGVEVERETITLYADNRIVEQFDIDNEHRKLNSMLAAGILTYNEARQCLGLGCI